MVTEHGIDRIRNGEADYSHKYREKGRVDEFGKTAATEDPVGEVSQK